MPDPLFKVPPHHYAGLPQLPLFVLLGVGAGLLATIISRGLFLIEDWYRRLPIKEFWHPVIGAVIFATIGLFVPRALGVGYDAIGDVLSNRLAIGTIAVLAGAKLLAWWAALASGTSGGTLAPILLISAGYGSLFGAAVNHLFPTIGVSPGAFAVVAMAATFGAATRATLTAMVFVFELTRDYDVILPLMLATVVADLIAGSLMRDSIMTEKLTRRGLRVHTEYEVDRFRTVPVADVMTAHVDTLPANATLGDVRRCFATRAHSAYPIVDGDGRCVGIVSRGDLLFQDDGARPHTGARVRHHRTRIGRSAGSRGDRAATDVGGARRAPSRDRCRRAGRHLYSHRPPPRAGRPVRPRTPPTRVAATVTACSGRGRSGRS